MFNFAFFPVSIYTSTYVNNFYIICLIFLFLLQIVNQATFITIIVIIHLFLFCKMFSVFKFVLYKMFVLVLFVINIFIPGWTCCPNFLFWIKNTLLLGIYQQTFFCLIHLVPPEQRTGILYVRFSSWTSLPTWQLIAVYYWWVPSYPDRNSEFWIIKINILSIILQLYYRQKGNRAVTRPQALQESFEQCADIVVAKLQSYFTQADEYHNQCLQGKSDFIQANYNQSLRGKCCTSSQLAITSPYMISVVLHPSWQ